jgi:predicted DNA-binding protein (MmcQ/YjbR family)
MMIGWHSCVRRRVARRLSWSDRPPERFFVPPYVGHRGWLGVYLDVPVGWGEIATLVENAYRAVAPRRLLVELETAKQKPGKAR